MLVLQSVIKPGSIVKKGDVVAEFDRQYMLNRLDDYRASVIQAEASMRKQFAEIDVNRKAYELNVQSSRGSVEKAQLDLKTLPVRSAIQSEQFRLALEEAVAWNKQVLAEEKLRDVSDAAQKRTTELELSQAKVELKRAEANANRMIAKAPIEGLVVMQTIFRGGEFSQIQQGDQLYPGQFYMQIVDTRSMVVNATVNQVDVEQMRVGQKARVRFDAYPDLELPARVFALGAMPRTGGFRASYMKEVPVRLKLEKLDPRVIPDLTVSVDIVLQSEDQALAAPLEAVHRDGPSGRPYAFVQRGVEWERREIETGMTNNVAVVVKSGLRPGEVVAAGRPTSGKPAAGPG